MNALDAYADAALRTAVYPNRGTTAGLAYATLGLTGEAGEIANKVKKVMRDGATTDGIASELGDCLWYVAAVADELGVSLSEVARLNLAKLHRRAVAGTIGGSGDER